MNKGKITNASFGESKKHLSIFWSIITSILFVLLTPHLASAQASNTPICGNGVIDYSSGEVCDLSANPTGAGANEACINNCTTLQCMAGYSYNGTKTCSATNPNNSNTCGNGVVDYSSGEVCDLSANPTGAGANEACINSCTTLQCMSGYSYNGTKTCTANCTNVTFYRDADNDGFGSANETTQACTAPTGFVSSSNDCNDSDVQINPNMAESCDGKDNNCNNQIDENLSQASSNLAGMCSGNKDVCSNGTWTAYSANYNPSSETCDGKDNDCNGKTDNNVTGLDDKNLCTADSCASGQIKHDTINSDDNNACTVDTCDAATGISHTTTDSDKDGTADCSDACPSDPNKNAAGVCGCGVSDTNNIMYRQDNDKDGVGGADIGQSCTQPAGSVTTNGDCNDNDAQTFPGNTEVCDGKDNNCDAQVDEGFPDDDSDKIANCIDTQTCNNGIVEGSEQCDGTINVTSGYACDNNCNLTCADGYQKVAGTNTCSPVNTCGNGVVDSGESCDTNTTLGANQACNNCQTSCVTGFHFEGKSCVQDAICGNNVIESGEQCDDGNLVKGDGCGDVCVTEKLCADGSYVAPEDTCQDYCGDVPSEITSNACIDQNSLTCDKNSNQWKYDYLSPESGYTMINGVCSAVTCADMSSPVQALCTASLNSITCYDANNNIMKNTFEVPGEIKAIASKDTTLIIALADGNLLTTDLANADGISLFATDSSFTNPGKFAFTDAGIIMSSPTGGILTIIDSSGAVTKTDTGLTQIDAITSNGILAILSQNKAYKIADPYAINLEVIADFSDLVAQTGKQTATIKNMGYIGSNLAVILDDQIYLYDANTNQTSVSASKLDLQSYLTSTNIYQNSGLALDKTTGTLATISDKGDISLSTLNDYNPANELGSIDLAYVCKDTDYKPDPNLVICADGSILKPGMVCPAVEQTTTCPDGGEVAVGTACPEYCGDYVTNNHEACDPTDANNTQANAICTTDCQKKCLCDTNYFDISLPAGAYCDYNSCDIKCTDTNQNYNGTECVGNTPVNTCGNGAIDSGESCDTNTALGANQVCNNCQTSCVTGFHFEGKSCMQDVVQSVCGNNVIESGEQCDDGNSTMNDGCSSTCQSDGSITVCVLIADTQGNTNDGSDTPGATFVVPGITPTQTSDDAAIGQIPDSTFSTPLQLNQEIIANNSNVDAQCTKYSGLKIGSYYYGQETISPSDNWATALYNDQYASSVQNLNDFLSYSSLLFDGNASNDSQRNINADGQIKLSTANPNRTLLVLNVYQTPTQAQTTCGNGVIDSGESCDTNTALGTNQVCNNCQTSCVTGFHFEGKSCVQDVTCGNGVIDSGESCDDGNTSSNDGCDNICATEATCSDGSLPTGKICVSNLDELDPGLTCYNVDQSLETATVGVQFNGYLNVQAMLAENSLVFTVGDSIHVVQKDLTISSLRFSDFTWTETAPQVIKVLHMIKADSGKAVLLAEVEREGVRDTELFTLDGDAMEASSIMQGLDEAQWIAAAGDFGFIGGNSGIKKIVNTNNTFSLEPILTADNFGADYGSSENTTAGFYLTSESKLIFTVVNQTTNTSEIYAYDPNTAVLQKIITDIPFMIPSNGLIPAPDGGAWLIISAGDRIEGVDLTGMTFPVAYNQLTLSSTVPGAIPEKTGQIITTTLCDGTVDGPYSVEICDGIDNDGDRGIDEDDVCNTAEPCGNGKIEPLIGENCEPSDASSFQSPQEICNTSCQIECAEGYTLSATNECVPVTTTTPSCGDGVMNQPSEFCDGTDGVNTGYICDTDCTLDCAEGYTLSATNECVPVPTTTASCGDGIMNQISELCDGTEGVTTGYICTINCTLDCAEGYTPNDTNECVPIVPAATASCGDGIINQSNEECDVTAGVSTGYTCNTDCTLSCAEGYTLSAATNECVPVPTTTASCGDGVMNQPSELCDGSDGVDPGYMCNTDCTLDCAEGYEPDSDTGDCTAIVEVLCGNGVVDATEQCDINLSSSFTTGESCDSECQIQCDSGYQKNANGRCDRIPESCGDGIVQVSLSETCESGVTTLETNQECTACQLGCRDGYTEVSGQGCVANVTCGDGQVGEGEQCDIELLSSWPTGGSCDSNCQTQCDSGYQKNSNGRCDIISPYCGDGEVGSDEDCEEGVTTLGENQECQSCQIVCTNDLLLQSGQCVSPVTCGDGTTSIGEQCDPQNATSFNSSIAMCNPTNCQIECLDGYTLTNGQCVANDLSASTVNLSGDGTVDADAAQAINGDNNNIEAAGVDTDPSDDTDTLPQITTQTSGIVSGGACSLNTSSVLQQESLNFAALFILLSTLLPFMALRLKGVRSRE